VAGSTACGEGAKPEAHERAASALRAWLADNGHAGAVEPSGMTGFHRVRFDIKGTPTVSVVIPSGCKRANLHGKETWFVARCVETIRQQSTYPRVEVIVLYNETIDPELASELERHGARLVNYARPGPFNLADKMNAGAAQARGEQLLFLNDDIEVLSADWIESMLEFAQQDGIGAVGAKLLFPNGRLQHGGVLIPGGNPTHAFYAYPAFYPGYFNSQLVLRNWIAVTGACMMTRTEVFRAVGGFDVAFPLNYNDIDYCLRLRERDLRCVCTPYARLVHHEAITKDGLFPAELTAFHERWRTKLPRDPYYNDNFDQGGHDFRIDPRLHEGS
jgi:glycosyltransferase involved in cell wall biosynthesis